MRYSNAAILNALSAPEGEHFHVPFFWDSPKGSIPLDPVEMPDVVHLSVETWMVVCRRRPGVAVRLCFEIGLSENTYFEVPPQTRQILEENIYPYVYPAIDVYSKTRIPKGLIDEKVNLRIFEREQRSEMWPRNARGLFTREKSIFSELITEHSLYLWLIRPATET